MVLLATKSHEAARRSGDHPMRKNHMNLTQTLLEKEPILKLAAKQFECSIAARSPLPCLRGTPQLEPRHYKASTPSPLKSRRIPFLHIAMSESLGETESLDDLMARHRRETKDLQAKTTAAKKAAGSDKKKKKEATEEGERAEEMMRQRHKAEKEACEARERNAGAVEAAAKDGDGAAVQAAVEAIDALEMNERDDVAGNVETGEQKKKRNKARERAQRKAAELDEVRKQAAEEAKNLPNLKRIEEEQIKKLVEKEGLKVKDIAADGHCLYSAVADQLGDGRDYKQLRKLAAQFIRDNRDDFYPFMSGSDGEPLDDGGPSGQVR